MPLVAHAPARALHSPERPAARKAAHFAPPLVFPTPPTAAHAFARYVSTPSPMLPPSVPVDGETPRASVVRSLSTPAPTLRLGVQPAVRWPRAILAYFDATLRRTVHYRRPAAESDGPAAVQPPDRPLRGCLAHAVRPGSCKTWLSWSN